MRKIIVLFCLLVLAAGAVPARAQTPLARESVSVVTTGGIGGSGTYASDMVFAQWAGSQGGWGWAGGAAAVQGSAATHTGLSGGVTVIAANEVFSFDVGTLVTSLNSTYGEGNWTVANPTLFIQSSYSVQNNARFGLGSGTFSIYWVANNDWAQSTGTEDDKELNPPYESSAAALASWAGSLAYLGDGTFTIPEGASGHTPLYFTLLTSDPNYPLFVDALTNPSTGAGGYPALSLYLMGTSDTIGMLVYTGGPGGDSEPPPTLSFDVVAKVSASPDPLAFAGCAVGETAAPQTLTVTNGTNVACSIGASSRTGTNASEFAIATDGCSGTTLSPGGTCTISVTFSPASAGAKDAAILVPFDMTVNGQTYGTSLSASLSGTGGVATVTVTPESLDFGVVLLPDNNEDGNVPAGCTDNLDGTISCGVTIRNTSSVSLSGISLSTSGPFTVSPTAISTALAPNATATAAVTYAATSGRNGVDTGTLTVHAGSDTTSVALSALTSTRPGTPSNESPPEGTTVSSATPTLTGSAFSDADGDTHGSSTWEIGSDDKFDESSVVYVSRDDAAHLTSFPVPSGAALTQGATYYWRVTYTDGRGAASLPSAATSFKVPAVAMNKSGTTPLTMTVTDGAGNEVTSLSQLGAASAGGAVSPRLFADLGANVTINSGLDFVPGSGLPTVAIVKENGGSSSNVLAVVTPAGTNIVALTTTVPTDPSFDSVPPDNYTFPAGVVSFQLTGVSGSNNPVRITLYTPSDLPANAVWYKYTPAYGWLLVNSSGTYDGTGTALISSATTFTVVNGKGVLTIRDNDVTDQNPQNGVVLDPGAPAVPVQASSTTVADPGRPGGGGCFIATAAFGSYLSPYVSVLRSFRDTILLPTRGGAAFVAWYYRVSPPFARVVAGSEALRAAVRAGLVPAIGFGFLCLRLGVAPAMMLGVTLLLAAGLLLVLGARRLFSGRRP